ncbi:MAG: BrnA antitoxin family protein [Candidatus Rokuibacteriota bacterium]
MRLPPRKIPVSIRLDEDVISWFRERGGRYQTRMNAVLRAYMDSHASSAGVRDRLRSASLLTDLSAAREKAGRLRHLKEVMPSSFFNRLQAKIEAEADTEPLLKLPVLFFFLVRHDPPYLRRFDTLLGRLGPRHRKNLLDRLRGEEDYRHAAGAIFEVDILGRLIDTAPAASVTPCPRTGARNEADAALRLGTRTVFLETTLLTQTRNQERSRDIGTESAGGTRPGDRELMDLGIFSLGTGVVGAVGDPYGDALRVIGKLAGKREQLHPGAPNLVCLGLADALPHPTSVGWAVENLFTGTPTVARILMERARDAQTRATFAGLVRDFKAEPRLTGVLTFRIQGGPPAPLDVYRNQAAGERNALHENEWRQVLRLLGFDRRRAGKSARSTKRRTPGA